MSDYSNLTRIQIYNLLKSYIPSITFSPDNITISDYNFNTLNNGPRSQTEFTFKTFGNMYKLPQQHIYLGLPNSKVFYLGDISISDNTKSDSQGKSNIWLNDNLIFSFSKTNKSNRSMINSLQKSILFTGLLSAGRNTYYSASINPTNGNAVPYFNFTGIKIELNN